MAKKIYPLDQTGEYNAYFVPHEGFFYLDFARGKKLSLDFIPQFEIESDRKTIKKFDIVYSDVQTIVISQRLSDYLMEIFDENIIQFIPCILSCNDGSIDDYFILNVLHTEYIINEQKTEKIPLSEDKFSWGEPVLIDSSLKKCGIGRHNGKAMRIHLYFSDDLIQKLEEKEFTKGFVFV